MTVVFRRFYGGIIITLLIVLISIFCPSVHASSPADTQFGILYFIFQCRSISDIHDISKIEVGQDQWAPIPWFHWWGEPTVGYYCLTDHPEIFRKHAEQLRDAGIDFVILDVTNWPDYNPSLSSIASTDIEQPFLVMLQEWSKVPNAPKIVPWVRLGTKSSGGYNDMIYWLLPQLDKYPSLYYRYFGKPLILGITGSSAPELVNALSVGYTVRQMWALFTQPTNDWSFMQTCNPHQAFVDSQGSIACHQQPSVLNGQIEQISVAAAYQVDYMSDKRTATGKFDGRTFQRQFDAVFDNPGVPIVTITGWNEWVAQRFCIGANKELLTSNCFSETFPDGSRVFVDQYDANYSRDIEPAKGGKEDYYYELAKSCISLYKSGNKCDNVHSQNLCCQNYSANWKSPNLCSSSTISSSTLSSSNPLTVTMTVNKPVKSFWLAFYNPDNLFGPGNPKGIYFEAGKQFNISKEAPSLTQTMSFTINYADINKPDLNNNSQKPTNIQVNGYFLDPDTGQTSLPDARCVVQFNIERPGDLNGDGKVNISDYNILAANFGHPYTIFDYNILVGNFGK